MEQCINSCSLWVSKTTAKQPYRLTTHTPSSLSYKRPQNLVWQGCNFRMDSSHLHQKYFFRQAHTTWISSVCMCVCVRACWFLVASSVALHFMYWGGISHWTWSLPREPPCSRDVWLPHARIPRSSCTWGSIFQPSCLLNKHLFNYLPIHYIFDT